MNNSIIHANYAAYDYHPWIIDINGKHAQIIRRYMLDDGIPEDGVNSIIRNSAKVLNYCPNPYKVDPVKETGIVIGKVQSGKTSNFITITSIAFDNGYDFVIIFGGTKIPLVQQNSERVEEYFKASKGEVVVLNTNQHLDMINEQDIRQFIQMGKKVIIITLKNTAKINHICNNVFLGTPLAESAILIIDDEGDEASLNNQISKGKKSPTYLAIENLKNSLHRHCFISVTATPQANMLISTVDVLSPSFGVLIEPGNGYCGLDVFHGSNSKFTCTIPQTEASLLEDGIPKSFYQAISMFFVACAVYKKCGMKIGDKMSMLIHPSQMKADHNIAYSKVVTLIKDWRKRICNKDDISYSLVKTQLQKAYGTYKHQGTEVNGHELPPYDDLEDNIIAVINCCHAHIINGDHVSKDVDKFYDYNIYVGGTMLGRGLTLNGLVTTYIIRTTKGTSSVDTVQQRARWFGYKRKYLDLCRVFAVDKIVTEFQNIRDHEEDLWDTISEADIEGTRFKDIVRIFTLSDKMRMTRTSVAKTINYSFSFWNHQRVFQRESDYTQSNISIINEFRNKYLNQLRTQYFGSGSPFVLLEDVTFLTVYKEFLSRFIFPVNSKLNLPLISKLCLLFSRKGINAKVDVIWMRDGITSKHPIRDDGSIPNYMTGRRPQEDNLPQIYAGDAYQFRKNDVIQLQVHMIEDTITGAVSPALALYIPIAYVERLTNLVIRA